MDNKTVGDSKWAALIKLRGHTYYSKNINEE